MAAAVLLTGCAAFERGADPAVEAPPDAVAVPDSRADASHGPDASGDAPTPDATADIAEEVYTGPSYEVAIHPLLMDECAECHSPGGGAQEFLTGNPEDDYPLIVDLVNIDNPEASRLLRKGSGATEHGGGPTLKVNSEEYATIVEWIAAGAPL